MKQLNIIFIFCALHALPLRAQQETILTNQFLQDNVKRVESIDPGDTNFQDLDFLKEHLSDVEVVLLGEQSHGDGASFLAKTRLIKYLHEELGYNVLVFESGMADAHRVWTEIRNGADSLAVFDLGIFPVWTQSEQVIPLMNYVIDQSKGTNPLVLAGFDMQPTGNRVTPVKRVDELMKYLKVNVKDFSEVNYPIFTTLFADFVTAIRNKPSSNDRDELVKEIRLLQKEIGSFDESIEGKIMSQYLLNLYKTLGLYWDGDFQNPSNTPHVFNTRDREMARNMIRLKEDIYSGQKIIVWGANTHIGYGRGFLRAFEGNEPPDRGMIPMGSYLKTEYQDKVYTISFTSAEGKIGSLRGDTYDLPAAKTVSLENQLSTLGIEIGFLSLREKKSDDLNLATRIYGHSEMRASWAKMTDAVFFIKKMQPSTKR